MKKLSPLKSIKAKCKNCVGFNFNDVKACDHEDCSLFTLRTGKRLKGHQPLIKIRKYCLECMKKSAPEVALCPSTDCDVFAYRFGRKEGRRIVSPKNELEG